MRDALNDPSPWPLPARLILAEVSDPLPVAAVFSEPLQWHRVADSLPDDDITILAAWDDCTVEAVFRDGLLWRLCHSGGAAEDQRPMWWAEWPAGPK